ncbi:hypothetical protein NKR19_g9401 [Coniochaeta hoffmannii]|uniref:Mur ligase n=1 Tax=Coniochaeta hoffmannii TaxID=91930 RepID=A0AA38VBG0_9PEZI|nr:hypothetical protein NKR19_g9401 [Coniochaeta hoffmannii]
MPETYKNALALLRSRHRPPLSRPAKNHPNNLDMKSWLAALGHQNIRFQVIHITGTKGKGSTAVLTESFLRAHFRRTTRTVKIGLYTSPHLITERERIRIDSEPVSEEAFAKHFFDIWHALIENCDGLDNMPGYLQLLALLSVRVFEHERVDLAIYEVHAGGRKDATNFFNRPVACGFSIIGLDHVDILGPTVKHVAWHKSGIMKPGP